jgi:hypothetical protein
VKTIFSNPKKSKLKFKRYRYYNTKQTNKQTNGKPFTFVISCFWLQYYRYFLPFNYKQKYGIGTGTFFSSFSYPWIRIQKVIESGSTTLQNITSIDTTKTELFIPLACLSSMEFSIPGARTNVVFSLPSPSFMAPAPLRQVRIHQVYGTVLMRLRHKLVQKVTDVQPFSRLPFYIFDMTILKHDVPVLINTGSGLTLFCMAGG